MSHHHDSGEVHADSVNAGHEITDATPKSLIWFTTILTVFLIVVVAGSLVVFKAVTQETDENVAQDYQPAPLAALQAPSPAPPVQPALGSPGAPLHETMPYQDAIALKAIQDQLSGTYKNEEMPDHKVHNHMPVEAAINLLAEQGFPENNATNIPEPLGPAQAVPTPYSQGGRDSITGKAAAPGLPPPQQ